AGARAQGPLQSADLRKMRSVTAVALSPDATRAAYVVEGNDGPGRPYGQLWVMTLADGKTVRFGGGNDASGNPEGSPDGQWIAYRGRVGDKTGLAIARPDGTGARFIAEMTATNAPLPGAGRTIAWSPDGRRIAFVSSVPGPETADASGDPIVITRYLYKPDASEGLTRFNDNRRLHVFVADVASGRVEQITSGAHYEHSLEWSPKGELLFLSNHDADDDEFFNYDLFAAEPSPHAVPRRLTATESTEYHPRSSPDGSAIAFQATRRGLTDRETTMEDTHVWVMKADGSGRRELGAIDNRQGVPEWAPDGSSVYFTVQERGETHLYRVATTCGAGGQAACKPEIVIKDRGAVGSVSIAKSTIAYTLATATDQPELYVRVGSAAPRRLTDLNAGVLGGRTIAPVES